MSDLLERSERLVNFAADDKSGDGKWITLNGAHILIKGGRIEKGPKGLTGKHIGEHAHELSQKAHKAGQNALHTGQGHREAADAHEAARQAHVHATIHTKNDKEGNAAAASHHEHAGAHKKAAAAHLKSAQHEPGGSLEHLSSVKATRPNVSKSVAEQRSKHSKNLPTPNDPTTKRHFPDHVKPLKQGGFTKPLQTVPDESPGRMDAEKNSEAANRMSEEAHKATAKNDFSKGKHRAEAAAAHQKASDAHRLAAGHFPPSSSRREAHNRDAEEHAQQAKEHLAAGGDEVKRSERAANSVTEKPEDLPKSHQEHGKIARSHSAKALQEPLNRSMDKNPRADKAAYELTKAAHRASLKTSLAHKGPPGPNMDAHNFARAQHQNAAAAYEKVGDSFMAHLHKKAADSHLSASSKIHESVHGKT